jgi:hypothetical protein
MPPATTARTAPNERPGIDRHAAPPYAEFVRDYLKPNRPVVIGGALTEWKAFGTWTPQFFKERYGAKVLKIDREYRFDEYIDLVERSGDEHPAPYLFHLYIDAEFPELLEDIEPWPVYLTPNWLGRRFLPGNVGRQLHDDSRPGLFVGGLSTTCPSLHYDFQYHSFSFQLYGRKKFYLYDPAQTPFVYPKADKKILSEVKDVERPDLGRFPLFAKASPVSCVLEPGELLFIPSGWWHTTRLLGESVSVSVNTANAPNWPAVARELYAQVRPKHPYLARPFAAYMRLMGGLKALKERVTGPRRWLNCRGPDAPPAGGAAKYA